MLARRRRRDLVQRFRHPGPPGRETTGQSNGVCGAPDALRGACLVGEAVRGNGLTARAAPRPESTSPGPAAGIGRSVCCRAAGSDIKGRSSSWLASRDDQDGQRAGEARVSHDRRRPPLHRGALIAHPSGGAATRNLAARQSIDEAGFVCDKRKGRLQ